MKSATLAETKLHLQQSDLLAVQKWHAQKAASLRKEVSGYRDRHHGEARKLRRAAAMHSRYVNAITPFLLPL